LKPAGSNGGVGAPISAARAGGRLAVGDAAATRAAAEVSEAGDGAANAETAAARTIIADIAATTRTPRGVRDLDTAETGTSNVTRPAYSPGRNRLLAGDVVAAALRPILRP
jgi:hypothetical protein